MASQHPPSDSSKSLHFYHLFILTAEVRRIAYEVRCRPKNNVPIGCFSDSLILIAILYVQLFLQKRCVPGHQYNSVSITVTVIGGRLVQGWQVACTQVLGLIAVMAQHGHFTFPLLSSTDLVVGCALE